MSPVEWVGTILVGAAVLGELWLEVSLFDYLFRRHDGFRDRVLKRLFHWW